MLKEKKSEKTLVEGKNEMKYEEKKKRGKTFKRKKLAIYILEDRSGTQIKMIFII